MAPRTQRRSSSRPWCTLGRPRQGVHRRTLLALPGSVLVDRGARSVARVGGLVVVDHSRTRLRELPEVTARPRRGPGAEHDRHVVQRTSLFLSWTARHLLDHLARQREPAEHTWSHDGIETPPLRRWGADRGPRTADAERRFGLAFAPRMMWVSGRGGRALRGWPLRCCGAGTPAPPAPSTARAATAAPGSVRSSPCSASAVGTRFRAGARLVRTELGRACRSRRGRMDSRGVRGRPPQKQRPSSADHRAPRRVPCRSVADQQCAGYRISSGLHGRGPRAMGPPAATQPGEVGPLAGHRPCAGAQRRCRA